MERGEGGRGKGVGGRVGGLGVLLCGVRVFGGEGCVSLRSRRDSLQSRRDSLQSRRSSDQKVFRVEDTKGGPRVVLVGDGYMYDLEIPTQRALHHCIPPMWCVDTCITAGNAIAHPRFWYVSTCSWP